VANTNAAFGLRPVNGLTGGPYTGRVGRYYIPSTDTNTAAYIGSLVKPAGSADADGVMTVTANVSTGNPVVGVIVGVEPITQASAIYRENSTSRYVYVADDPNAMFVVQDDGASALTATVIGNACDLNNLTSGSTVTGLSSTTISTAAVTASGDGTEDVLIIGLLLRPDNAFGTYAKYVVRLNNHFYVDGVAGA
jgi:multidrug efflux pump subunit AcrA (membrane-fusion protein)